MPAKVGGVDRQDDHVAETGGNFPVAAWTQVGLGGLIRLDETFIQLSQNLRVFPLLPSSAWNRLPKERPGHEQDADDDSCPNVEHVARSSSV